MLLFLACALLLLVVAIARVAGAAIASGAAKPGTSEVSGSIEAAGWRGKVTPVEQNELAGDAPPPPPPPGFVIDPPHLEQSGVTHTPVEGDPFAEQAAEAEPDAEPEPS